MNTTNYGILRLTKYRNGPAMLATSEAVTQEVSAPMCSKSIPNSTTESIPYGYCHCGCGRKTRIAPRAETRAGILKGQPRKYVSGHQNRLPRGVNGKAISPIWSESKQCYLVPLPHGKYALVDECDLQSVSQHVWHIARGGRTRVPVAVATNIGGRTVRMHRLILNPPYGKVVDHINGDALDNRRSNLRICTQKDNAKNITRKRAGKTSRFLGVSWDKQRQLWTARVSVNRRPVSLGRFIDETEAAIARDVAAMEVYGEFASLNFPELREVFA